MNDLLSETSLKRILIEVARERVTPEHDTPSGYFHPTAMSKCERRVILEHAGVEGNPMSDETALFFWIGNVIHDAVQEGIAKKLSGTVWNEVHMRDETYKVSGRLDTLRLMLVGGEWYVVYEYKSQRTDAFNYKMPKPDHVLQVLIYCVFPLDCPACSVYEEWPSRKREWSPTCAICKGSGLVGPAKMGKLAYIGKEDGRLEVFDITPDNDLKVAVKQKLMRLQVLAEDYAKRRVLPDPLPQEPITDKKGVPQFYVKSSTKFGFKAGDPKMKDDYRVKNCPYEGRGCCGDS